MFNNKLIKININPIDGLQINQKIIDIIETGNVDEFLKFAKDYNIFQDSKNKFYLSICEKIKERLKRDNLDISLIQPEK